MAELNYSFFIMGFSGDIYIFGIEVWSDAPRTIPERIAGTIKDTIPRVAITTPAIRKGEVLINYPLHVAGIFTIGTKFFFQCRNVNRSKTLLFPEYLSFVN